METKLEALRNIVKRKMAMLDGTAHSFVHVDRVEKIATLLAEKEGADRELVQPAALLHDVGRTVGEPHNETGAKLAEEILKQSNAYSYERIEKIAKIVLHHPLAFKDKLMTLEEKIVWDADKIDLLGIIGVARIFHWFGKKPFETVVNICFDELKPLYGLLNTPSAKKIARIRYERTAAALSALKQEISADDIGNEICPPSS